MITQNDNSALQIITPSDSSQRGCQLSLQMKNPDKRLYEYISQNGIIADWREPDVIRVAPVPLYNTFEDVWHFTKILFEGLQHLGIK